MIDPWAKDCHCRTHSGPHWLHMDTLWRDRNRRLMGAGNVRGYVVEERDRLGALAREMLAHGVTQIPKDLRDQVEAEVTDRDGARLDAWTRGRRKSQRVLQAEADKLAMGLDMAPPAERQRLIDRINATQAECARIDGEIEDAQHRRDRDEEHRGAYWAWVATRKITTQTSLLRGVA